MDRMDLEEEDEEEDRQMDFDIHSTSVSVSALSSPEQLKLINYHHITTITTDMQVATSLQSQHPQLQGSPFRL